MKTEKATTEIAEPRPFMGLFKCLGWGALSLAVAVVIAMTWHRGSMASKLKETLAELDRTEPGWRFDDIEAAREDVPEAENSARVIVTNGTSARIAFFRSNSSRLARHQLYRDPVAATGSFPAFLAAGYAGLSDSLPLLTGIDREGGSGLALFKLLRPLLECLHGAGE